jgi:uncharacterized protein (UPF0335 family)
MTVSDEVHAEAKSHLRSFVERIERLETEKADLAADISEVYKEAKGNGFDTKALRKIIAMRRKEDHVRAEEEALLATYMQALGMLPQLADLPLGKAAMKMIGQSPQEAPGAEEASVAAHATADLDRARQRGADAADDGMKRMENPYIFSDPRYAAWDEGFTGAASAVAA